MVADRQRQRQWRAVTDELAEAIGTWWTNLRARIVQRYGLDDFGARMAAIAEAVHGWASLADQEAQQPPDIRGTAFAQWNLPTGVDEAVARASGIR